MQVVKGKDLRASGVGRSGGAGVGDVMRVFNRALELLSSNGADSESELLDMVKRAKRDTELEVLHPPKKPRSGRSHAESPEVLQALGHRQPAAPTPTAEQVSTQQADSASDAVAATAASSGSNPSMTQAQTRLMNVIRGGAGRGRIEKPRRKVTR